MSRPSKTTSQLQISICFSERETSFCSSAITTWFVPASRILGFSPPTYFHFLSGEIEESCALEKSEPIANATIAMKAKGSLIDETEFCLFSSPHGNDKMIRARSEEHTSELKSLRNI